jgi:TonB family protein
MEFMVLRNSESEDLAPLAAPENKAGRYLSVSVLLHAAMLASIALMSAPPIEFHKNEIVEFEVESDATAMRAIPDGVPVPETKGAAPSSPPIAVPHALPSALPDTLDDIQTPDLETSDSGDVALAQLDEKDLQEDFEKVDQAQHTALILAKKSLDEEADKAVAEGDETLNKVDEEAQAEIKAAALAAEKRRAQDAVAIAAARASEKASAETAAAREAGGGNGTGEEGEGTGNKGSPKASKEVAGIPGGVRSLEQLHQISGNKFPQYDKEERLAHQEGRAVFYAYVNKNGTLSQFKLGKSSGYRNLDAKTLAALKKWKFYPGQEGWVEMPFKWTLTGEAMEAGGQLRSSPR